MTIYALRSLRVIESVDSDKIHVVESAPFPQNEVEQANSCRPGPPFGVASAVYPLWQ
jgi:hypothetical protein